MKARAGDLGPVRAWGPALNVCRRDKPGNTARSFLRDSDGRGGGGTCGPDWPDGSLTPTSEVSSDSDSGEGREDIQHRQTLVHRSRIRRDCRDARLHSGQFADHPRAIAKADFVYTFVREQQAGGTRIAVDVGIPADRVLVANSIRVLASSRHIRPECDCLSEIDVRLEWPRCAQLDLQERPETARH